MTEDESGREQRRETSGKRRADRGAPPRARQRGLSGPQTAQRARRQLVEITGLKDEGVTSLERGDDGTWHVTVELLEVSRVPETDDMLGSYEAKLDEEGELLGYRRIRRYSRSKAEERQPRGGGGR